MRSTCLHMFVRVVMGCGYRSNAFSCSVMSVSATNYCTFNSSRRKGRIQGCSKLGRGHWDIIKDIMCDYL